MGVCVYLMAKAQMCLKSRKEGVSLCVWEREAGAAHPASGESANCNIC